jgi:hypothetical protein
VATEREALAMDEEPRNWGCLQALFVLAIVVGFTAIAVAVAIGVWASLNWPSGS